MSISVEILEDRLAELQGELDAANEELRAETRRADAAETRVEALTARYEPAADGAITDAVQARTFCPYTSPGNILTALGCQRANGHDGPCECATHNGLLRWTHPLANKIAPSAP